MQAQQNQPPQPAPLLPRDRHKEFISHNPPTYSHSTDPLDTDDWLKMITKKLEIVQCTDKEMVLYAASRLVGQAGDWWDAYTTACPNRHNITWQEFQDNFCTYHIPSGVIKLKQKEFLALRQGSMLVTEYLDKFTHLSRYAPDEVNTDLKWQERFLDGLIGPLNYQLQSHTFPDFHTLLNKAIGLESKRKELASRNTSSSHKGSQAVTLVPTSVHSRVRLSIFLVDMEESIHRTCSCNARFNHSVSTLRHRELLHLSRIAPIMALGHLSGTLPLFSPMGVSSVESWDTMLTTVLR
jgi:hypothetical protein